MSNSQTSSHNLRFGLIATAIIFTCAGIVSLCHKSLASMSRGVVYSLAEAEYNRGNDSTAIRLLSYDRPMGVQSLNLETKAYLEEGSPAEAVPPAQVATQLAPHDSTSILLLGAADALSGRPVSDSKAPEGLDDLRTANSAQAQELYVLGLLRSSQKVLLTIDQPSAQRAILLANIALALTPGKTGAITATPYAKEAVALDPSNQVARKLYISVSHKTGDTVTANRQAALLAQLEIGRP
jgi:hypothetical protein